MSPTPYDAVRYPGKFYPQASVERLATLAALHGMRPAPPDACRVLELGCGDGGHLVPQASAFPRSRFVGVDLAASAIADGRATVSVLGLDNLDLQVGDIGTFEPGDEPFDYVIAHGVLSWVPEDVRQRLVALCGRALAPHGVAYLSYATLPGGYLRNVPRDLMRFHTRRVAEPASRVRAAREVIEFMRAAQPAEGLGRMLLEREMAGTEGKDWFLLHDLLAEENEPLYFTDVMDVAAREGLGFVAEAEPSAMSWSHFPAPVREQLARIPERLEREQYVDFLNLCRFRQSLLCRAEVAVDATPTPARLATLHVATRLRPVRPDADPAAGGALAFRDAYGGLDVEDPDAKVFLLALSRGDPRGEPYAALCDACGLPVGTDAGAGAERASRLARFVQGLYAADRVAIRTTRGRFVADVGPRPRVEPLVRLLAERRTAVVNGSLDAFFLPSEPLRRLVMLLDGSRDHDALLEALLEASPAAEREAIDAASLRRRLDMLASSGMLVG